MGFAPAIGAGLSIAKGIMGAAGAESSAAATSSNYLVQGQIALNNAVTAAQNEQWETGFGEYKAAQTGMVNAAKIGAGIATQARGGVDVNSGSNLAARVAATRAGVQDEASVMSDTARKAYGYRVAQTNFANQASADSAGAANARTAGRMAAMGSLLDGVAGAFGAGGAGKFLFGGGGDQTAKAATPAATDAYGWG